MSERAIHELVSDVSWAIAQRLPKRDLLAMLARLVASAAPGSPEERFAKLELARLVVDKQPFRAARLAQEVLSSGPDEVALGLLGIAHMRSVIFGPRARVRKGAAARPGRSGRCSTISATSSTWHSIDPTRRSLTSPTRSASSSDEPAIASSYAHALARTGQEARAEQLLVKGARLSPGLAHATVEAWTRVRALAEATRPRDRSASFRALQWAGAELSIGP